MTILRTGLMLLGEVYGVRENPLLMQAFGLTSLVLEWEASASAPIPRAPATPAEP